MTSDKLKEYIYENNKIEYILENLGCHNIKFNELKGYYSATQPDGDNLQGVNIKNNKYLSYRSFSRGITYDDNKDLISLVMDIKGFVFTEAMNYIHNLLGLEYDGQAVAKSSKKAAEALKIFKKIKDRRKHSLMINVDDVQYLDEKLLNDYVPLLHIDWYREGIMPWTRKVFDIEYSYQNKRIVIPHKHWKTGELLGFNMRTTVEGYEEFGIKKYFLTSGYNKSLNLYGLYENKEEIEKKGYCTIVEAEKSVLKRHSLGDGTCVALSGKTISPEQVRIINSLKINEVVLCLDNDVDMADVKWIAKKFENTKKVSIIKDRWDILKEKDSPCDASNKDYKFLFENRIVYPRNN